MRCGRRVWGTRRKPPTTNDPSGEPVLGGKPGAQYPFTTNHQRPFGRTCTRRETRSAVPLHHQPNGRTSTRRETRSAVPLHHQPPTTNHQPPTTNHQPPTTNHQPPTTNHQPPTPNS
ncbi:MAG: hypothetical protein ACHBN1_00650 [Heteroscytonema crispum UTEX LB 1556]